MIYMKNMDQNRIWLSDWVSDQEQIFYTYLSCDLKDLSVCDKVYESNWNFSQLN